MIGIYKITSPNNKVYIGQSTNIEKRFKTYLHLHCKNQRKLYFSLLKYGVDKHKFEIIEECGENVLLERETYWKEFYNILNIPSLCCRIDGRGGRLSEETNIKIRLSKLGTKMSNESSLKKREKMIGKSKHTDESKKLIGDKNRHKKPIGFSEKLKKPKTQEHKNNLSLAKSKKPIIQYDLQMNPIQEWISGAKAAKTLGFLQGCISVAIRKNKKYKNYYWKNK